MSLWSFSRLNSLFQELFFLFKTEKSWSVKVFDSAYYELKSCLGSGYQTTRNKLLRGSCCLSLLDDFFTCRNNDLT